MINDNLQEQLRKEFNPDGSELRNHQLKCKEILDVIDKLCRENNITYWLASGTLLGAVRHKGFIPWDDDIDIEILYKDRRRFIRACESLPEHYILQYHSTDPDYYSQILKVRSKEGNVHETIYVHGREYDSASKFQGYFIDIFTEEPSTLCLVKLSNKLLSLLHYIKYRCKGGRFMMELLYHGSNIIYSIMRLLSKLNPWAKLYYHSYGSFFHSSRQKKDLLPVTEIEFEGTLYKAPSSPHDYLTRMFGNYMELPSHDHRSPHHDKNIGTK